MKRDRDGVPVGGVLEEKRADPTGNAAIGVKAKPAATTGTTAAQNVKLPRSTSKYHYAVICSSNVNRSMEAHVALMNDKIHVSSFGAGRCVHFIFFVLVKGTEFYVRL